MKIASLGILTLPDTISSAGTQSFISHLQQVDQKVGKFQSAVLLGFIKVENDNGKYIRYTGMTVREKKTIPITVLVDRKIRKITYFGFKM